VRPTACGITISDYAYEPTGISVATGTINPGKSTTITLGRPGTYTYFCQFHAFMHGTITVR
jgi:hypothetical protein